MKNKVIFEKVYTRDTCIIIQQAWINVFRKKLEEKLGKKNPNIPQIIYYMTDGVLEIWENRKATEWLKGELLLMNKNNPSFTISLMNWYRERLKLFERYWAAGAVKTVRKLSGIVDNVFEAMLGYIVMYYSSITERTPVKIKEIVDPIRVEDKFFDENDKLIRSSLIKIYPNVRGYETAILKNEIGKCSSVNILKARSKHAIIFSGGVEIITLDEFLKRNPEYFFSDYRNRTLSLNEFSGFVAMRGIAKGMVRIIKRKDQVSLAKDGEIIVSSMTTPDYVPAMKKAVGFITDEGGIMCHAAIIARELKKPCIIGTKIATKVLKDGDLVEVDADKGVVKILKN